MHASSPALPNLEISLHNAKAIMMNEAAEVNTSPRAFPRSFDLGLGEFGPLGDLIKNHLDPLFRGPFC